MEFSLTIKYVNAQDNAIADWLSRSVSIEQLPPYSLCPIVNYLEADLNPSLFKLLTNEELSSEAKAEGEKNELPKVRWFNDLPYHVESRRIYIPKLFRESIVLWFHGSRLGGHQGIRRTEKRVKEYCWWPKMRETMEEVINNCILCNFQKVLTAKRTVKMALIKPHLFELISLDFIGPRRFHGNTYYILVVIDHFSRFMICESSTHPSQDMVIQCLQQRWLPLFGSPNGVLCDHGGAFIGSKFINYVNKVLSSRLIYASVEYPRGNGLNESSHRILETAIESHPDWAGLMFPEILSNCVLIYNSSPNISIGNTPAALVYGKDPRLPGLEVFN